MGICVQVDAQEAVQPWPTIVPFGESLSRPLTATTALPPGPATASPALNTPAASGALSVPDGVSAPQPPRSRMNSGTSMPPPSDRACMRSRNMNMSMKAATPPHPEAVVLHMRDRRGWCSIINPYGTRAGGSESPSKRSGKAPTASRAEARSRTHRSRRDLSLPAHGSPGKLKYTRHASERLVGSNLFRGPPGAPPLPPPERYREHLRVAQGVRVAQARRAQSEGAPTEVRGANSVSSAARIESITGALEMISSAVREAEGSLRQLW